MSLDPGAIARRLVVGIAGLRLARAEKQWLDHWKPSGVILFARNCVTPAAWRRLIAELREVLPPGGECCADHEGGPVSFLQALAGRPPAPRTLGELDDVRLTRRVHRETAERLRDLGLDRVLAPCCDVLREPVNPVIGARSFGCEAELVARHAAAAMEGLAEGGLKGCPKHWPGHGATKADTHEQSTDDPVAVLRAESESGAGRTIEAADAGPVTREPAADRDVFSIDHRPFHAALTAGADALMIGHLPAGAGRPPLTLDAQGLARLRSALGPATLLFSDDVSMGALRAPLASLGVTAPDARASGLVDPADLTIDWLRAVAEAGCDRMLLRGIPWRALPSSELQASDLPCVSACGPDLLRTGPPSAVYAQARLRAAGSIMLRHGDTGLLWFDTTGGDRLGEAVDLSSAIDVWWPNTLRVDAGVHAGDSGGAAFAGPGPTRICARILVTAHRPLTAVHAQRLLGLAAAGGVALAAGHPSLAADIRRLLGPDWHVDALYDCAEPDLAPLNTMTAARPPRSVDSP